MQSTRPARRHPYVGSTLRNRPASRPLLAAALLTVLGVLVALVPTGPAHADPAPSTMTIDGTGGRQYDPASARVTLEAIGAEPSGVVVFSEGGTTIGQATLVRDPYYSAWHAGIELWFDTAGPHTITATYAGSPTVAPATASITLLVTPFTRPYPVTGTITTGTNVTHLGHGSGYQDWLYDPVSGSINKVYFDPTAHEFTRDVPGTGPVTVKGGQYWVYSPPPNSQGGISPDGTFTGGTIELRFSASLITIGGVTWVTSGSCDTAVAMNMTGALEPGGLHLTASTLARFTKIAPVDPTRCAGFASKVDAVLAGSASMDLHVSGAFPPPPPDDTPTITVVTAEGGPFTVGDRSVARATVTAGFPVTPTGYVEFALDGVVLTTTNVIDGIAQANIDLDTAGSSTITARYLGVNSSHGQILVPSTASTTVAVAEAPPGRPATGQVVAGTSPPIALPAGTRLTGAAFDPATGAIGPGSFWLPAAGTIFHYFGGDPGVRYRLTQTGPITGQVARDGTVTFSPATFRIQVRALQFPGQGIRWLDHCSFEPITAALHGTADATGLHLTATGVKIPTVDDNACDEPANWGSRWGSSFNDAIAGPASFSFDVAGDFRRDHTPTPVAVASWFPSVALHNQTYLTARVTSSPNTPATGAVTFRDGPTVLGVAPLDATGLASLVTEMDQTGPRTITADYAGDTVHEPGTATTTMTVTPAPAGHPITGTIDLAGTTVPIGAGSTLVPATATTPAALWFTPATVSLDLPGTGHTQAEVRLVQSGALSAATIGPGGTIDGLAGTFVLQVRKVTTTTGTTRPVGCANLALYAFTGHLTFTTADLTTTHGGTGRIPSATCTGLGQAVIDHLTGPSHATIHATL